MLEGIVLSSRPSRWHLGAELDRMSGMSGWPGADAMRSAWPGHREVLVYR